MPLEQHRAGRVDDGDAAEIEHDGVGHAGERLDALDQALGAAEEERALELDHADAPPRRGDAHGILAAPHATRRPHGAVDDAAHERALHAEIEQEAGQLEADGDRRHEAEEHFGEGDQRDRRRTPQQRLLAQRPFAPQPARESLRPVVDQRNPSVIISPESDGHRNPRDQRAAERERERKHRDGDHRRGAGAAARVPARQRDRARQHDGNASAKARQDVGEAVRDDFALRLVAAVGDVVDRDRGKQSVQRADEGDQSGGGDNELGVFFDRTPGRVRERQQRGRNGQASAVPRRQRARGAPSEGRARSRSTATIPRRARSAAPAFASISSRRPPDVAAVASPTNSVAGCSACHALAGPDANSACGCRRAAQLAP